MSVYAEPHDTWCRRCSSITPHYMRGGCVACAIASLAHRRADDPDRHRTLSKRHQLQYQYKMTLEEYEAMLVAQDGHCATCPITPEQNGRALDVDHDHDCCPGKRSCGRCVRGLLCMECNKYMPKNEDQWRRWGEYLGYVDVVDHP